MLTRAHEDLWAAVRDDLRCRLGEERFDRWIAPLKVLSETGQELRLGVANRFVQDWIEKRYLSVILSVLRQREGEEPRVRLVIDAILYQERCRERDEVLGEAGLAKAVAAESGGAAGEALGVHGTAPAWSRGGVPAAGETVKSTKARSGSSEQTLESFVVGASNQLAYNATMQVLQSPGSLYNPLFLHGPTGVGKTHLLKGLYQVFRTRRHEPSHRAGVPFAPGGYIRVSYVTGEQFFQHFASSVQDGNTRKFRERYRSLDVLILDDVQLLLTKRKTQVEFLHTFNALQEVGRQIVLASDVQPKALKELDVGLVGRFLSGLVVGIQRPDFATRLGILRAQASRLASRIEDTILEFVAEHVRGNARELVGALMKIDIHAQLNGGTLSLDEARDLLAEFARDARRRLDLERIRDVVAAHYRLEPSILASPSRQRHISFARQVAMFLSRRHTAKSLAEIGKYFGNRNHTTVKCAEVKIARLVGDGGGNLTSELRAIEESLED